MRLLTRSIPIYSVALCFSLLAQFSLALLPQKSLRRDLPKSRVASSLMMYFDDGSRRGQQQWKPSDSSGFQLPQQQPETQPFLQSVEEEKLDAIQRMLIGYDAETASDLTEDEIMEQIEVWASRSGVVGSYFGDELFDEMLGTSVCNATTLVGGLAQFWASIVQVIDASTDEFAPQRWTTGGEDSWRARRRRQEGTIPEQVHFVVFPNCPELYDYKTMFTFVMAMEFSKEQCLYLGKKFLLTLFHPKYKNSPKMFSPERHSPFPSSGLHFGDRTPCQMPQVKPSVPKRQRGNAKSTFTSKKVVKKKANEEDEEEDENSEIVDRKIRDLDLQRAHLEVMFNSAAASGSDGESIVSPRDFKSPSDLDASLSATFREEQQNRRRMIPPSEVKELSEVWIDQNQFLDSGRRHPNKALQLAGTVSENGWVVSSHFVAEKVYADIWKAVSELYEIGQAAEQTLAEKQPEEARAEEALKEPFDWMKTISQSFHPDRSKKEAARPSEIISTMFVATKFCAYNSPAFKRFAITVNAPLKRLTGGRMFLEVFHPEYVGKNGYTNVLRRSPFPMIQICYEITSVQTNEED